MDWSFKKYYHLRNTIIKKEIPENENSDKIADIVEKICNFNKQKKDKKLKILTPNKYFKDCQYLSHK